MDKNGKIRQQEPAGVWDGLDKMEAQAGMQGGQDGMDGTSGMQGDGNGQDALEAAERMAEGAGFEYIHTLQEPLAYEGEEYRELHFNWGRLKGWDAIAIEREMQALGEMVVIPSLSGGYLMRMAARACKEDIGFDAFQDMKIRDYNAIRGKARSFLLRSES